MAQLPSATALVQEHLEVFPFGGVVLHHPHSELLQPVEDTSGEHLLVSPGPDSGEIHFLQGLALEDGRKIVGFDRTLEWLGDECIASLGVSDKPNGVHRKTELAEVLAQYRQSHILILDKLVTRTIREVGKYELADAVESVVVVVTGELDEIGEVLGRLDGMVSVVVKPEDELARGPEHETSDLRHKSLVGACKRRNEERLEMGRADFVIELVAGDELLRPLPEAALITELVCVSTLVQAFAIVLRYSA